VALAAVMEICLLCSLSNVARLAAYPKFVWVFNANSPTAMGQSFILTLYIWMATANLVITTLMATPLIKDEVFLVHIEGLT
jgi:hypothetical protein